MPLIVFLAAFVLVVFLICILVGSRNTGEFQLKFPPISDEEFVARCSPGTDPEIALKVRRIVAKQLGVEYERIHPSCHFINDLGAD
jgi:hypothetical protein